MKFFPQKHYNQKLLFSYAKTYPHGHKILMEIVVNENMNIFFSVSEIVIAVYGGEKIIQERNERK